MDQTISEDMIVNDIISKFPVTVKAFKDYGIDSCCGGGFSLKEAAKRHGISLKEILEELNKVANF